MTNVNDKRTTPNRFTILSITLKMHSAQGNLILSRHADTWSCMCDHFHEHRECSHVQEAKQFFFTIETKEERP